MLTSNTSNSCLLPCEKLAIQHIFAFCLIKLDFVTPGLYAVTLEEEHSFQGMLQLHIIIHKKAHPAKRPIF